MMINYRDMSLHETCLLFLIFIWEANLQLEHINNNGNIITFAEPILKFNMVSEQAVNVRNCVIHFKTRSSAYVQKQRRFINEISSSTQLYAHNAITNSNLYIYKGISSQWSQMMQALWQSHCHIYKFDNTYFL